MVNDEKHRSIILPTILHCQDDPLHARDHPVGDSRPRLEDVVHILRAIHQDRHRRGREDLVRCRFRPLEAQVKSTSGQQK